MRQLIRSRVAASLGFALVLASALAAQAGAGDKPKGYTFRTPPLDSLGVKSLADLRGKPVLIDFWGTR